jgi:hypothetical protein
MRRIALSIRARRCSRSWSKVWIENVRTARLLLNNPRSARNTSLDGGPLAML